MDRKMVRWIERQIDTNNGIEQKRFNFKPWKKKTNKLVGRNLLRIIRAQNIQGLRKQTTSTQTKTIQNLNLFFIYWIKK